MDLDSTGKEWENINISKSWFSEIFWVTQKSMQFQKHEENGFPEYGKCTVKHKHFNFMDF